MHMKDRDLISDEEARELSRPKTRRRLSGQRVPLDTPERDSKTATGILQALQHHRIYLGTVSGKVKASRRKKNRLQKASRKANR